MAKLYPPNLGGTVPAFYGNILTVPFIMNKTVSKSEIGGFNLIIKTVANSKLIGQLRLTARDNALTGVHEIVEWNIDTNELTFDINQNISLVSALSIGQYYKLQLAYIDTEGVIGYYSSVGIVKYTAEPSVTIEGLDYTAINMNHGVYVGSYSQETLMDGTLRDTTERAYSYIFNVYDANGKLIETSGDCLHNSFEDTSTAYSRDIYNLQKELEMNQSYYIQYIVTTNNKLVKKSNKYRIMQKESIDPEISAEIKTELNSDNGYIKVKLVGLLDDMGVEAPAYGSYVLKRASDKDGYGAWNTVYNFKLNGQVPSSWNWKDCTVEHGYTYQYALQQFNDDNLYSNKIYSEKIYVYFEDSFLFDGERQLKIRFNPKISSFKNVVLETKTDTIGSQYPFIFRNGHVYYKEFPISGLISYMSDEEELFITKEEIMLEEPTFDLTHNNIVAERLFKQKVHEFLNDGNPKIFRSPTEGSFIVRLLNVSLSPTDAVSRMLHTFSATAYEVDKFNYQSFINYGFLKLPELKNNTTRWETVMLYDEKTGMSIPAGTELLSHKPATSILLQDIIPGTQFTLKYKDGNKNISENILIGPTGTYKIDLEDLLEFYSVSLNSKNDGSGSLVYSYQSSTSNVFDTVSDIKIEDFIVKQYLGAIDIIEEIEDTKLSIVKFNYLRFFKRPVYEVYSQNGINLYWDEGYTNSIGDLVNEYIYLVTLSSGNQYYVDGRYPRQKIKDYSNEFVLNGASIDLTETEGYELMDIYNVTELKLGVGVFLECSYQLKEVSYSIETTDIELRNQRMSYKVKYNHLLDMLHYETEGSYYNDLSGYTPAYFSAVKSARSALIPGGASLWENYINNLNKALEEQKKASGII